MIQRVCSARLGVWCYGNEQNNAEGICTGAVSARGPLGGREHPMSPHIFRILRDDRGIAALEYALIAGLIFAAIIACGHLYGPALETALSNIGTSIDIRDLGT